MKKFMRTFLLIISSLLLFSCTNSNEKNLPIGVFENVVMEEEGVAFDVKVTDKDSVIVDGTLKVMLCKNGEVVSELSSSELINTELVFSDLLPNNEYVMKLEVKYDLGNGTHIAELATETIDLISPLIISEDNFITNTGNYTIIANEQFNEYSIDNGMTWISIETTDNYKLTNLAEGTYNIVIKDTFSNESEKVVLLVDKTAPIVTSSYYDRLDILDIITVNDIATHDTYRFSLAIQESYVVIGRPNDSIYVYDLFKAENDEGYERKITSNNGTDNDKYGDIVVIDGNYVVVGACGDNHSRGSIYVYDLTKGENDEGFERKVTASDGAENDYFGNSVAIKEDYVVVGAVLGNNGKGSIYIYDLTKRENEEGFERKITASNGKEMDFFGNSVAIESNYVVVGTCREDSKRGSVYIYDLSKGENEEGYERKITASDGAENDYFGNSVAIEGNYVVVGAYRDDNNSGSIYIYDLSKGENEEGYERKIIASDRAVGDCFGYNVSIDGSYVMVEINGGDNTHRHSIYVYDLSKTENEEGYERKIIASDGDIFKKITAIEDKYVVEGYNKTQGSIYLYANTPFYKLHIKEQNGIETIEVTKDGNEISQSLLFTEEGNYVIKVTDKAGNETILNLEVVFEK